MDGSNGIVIDAVPQQIPVTFIESESHKFKIEDLLAEFSPDDYKSAFFLLMDFIKPVTFLNLTQQNIPCLKESFISLYRTKLNESLLVELLGTLKMYKKLRMLGTCFHVYESRKNYNKKIGGIWKMLYSLCEELTDEVLDILKQQVESDYRNKILSMEDWFCWAFMKRLFSERNVSYLEETFQNYPECLDIIKSYKSFYKDFGLYNVRIPTAESDCGIAVIFNYETFNEKTGLENRKNSPKDVDALELLWHTFGFQVEIHHDLTFDETFYEMKKYAVMDYSNYDVFVCCILSHGDSNAVYSFDGKLMETEKLIAPIDDCVSLNEKPKLFFIQACQGPNIIEGDGRSIYRLQTSNNKPVEQPDLSPPPIFCDTLIVNSSIDGYVSFNDCEGSWFIQTLCKQMMEDGENSSIEEVMTMVHGEVKNKYSANLEKLGQNGVIQSVKNGYSPDFQPLAPSNAIQIVPRKSTLGKKLILRKRAR